MRSRLFIITIILLFNACGTKNKVPGEIITQKKMQAVMWDIMRADQFLQDYVLNKDLTKNKTAESIKYYQQIFALHRISEKEFLKSFSYYRTHPYLLKTIMDSLSHESGQAPTQKINSVVLEDTSNATPIRLQPTDTTIRFKKKKLFQ